LNIPANAWLGLYNISTIPFNAISEFGAGVENALRAIGFSETDIEAFRLLPVSEVATGVRALPSLGEALAGLRGLFGAAEESSALGGAAEVATTRLWRAVGDAELAAIEGSGAVQMSPSGLEFKYFSATEEGAALYAKQAVQGLGDAPYSFITTE